MPKYVIERDMPGAGRMTAEEIRAGAQQSSKAIAELFPKAQWMQSYVTDDKVYCIFVADDVDSIREHGRLSGLPCTATHRIAAVVDPSYAE